MKFFAERQSGHDAFRAAVEALPLPSATRIDDVAHFLDVTPATIRAWLAGTRQPPRSAVAAVWHESALGRAVTAPHAVQECVYLRGMLAATERQAAAMAAALDALRAELDQAKRSAAQAAPLAMNEPVFDPWRQPPRPPRQGLA